MLQAIFARIWGQHKTLFELDCKRPVILLYIKLFVSTATRTENLIDCFFLNRLYISSSTIYITFRKFHFSFLSCITHLQSTRSIHCPGNMAPVPRKAKNSRLPLTWRGSSSLPVLQEMTEDEALQKKNKQLLEHKITSSYRNYKETYFSQSV